MLAPDKVLIPERYLDLEVSAPLSPEEQREKQKKVERIKTLIAKSRYSKSVPKSVGYNTTQCNLSWFTITDWLLYLPLTTSSLQNVVPLLDGPVEGGHSEQHLQEQEKRIEISCALAAEASRRSRLLSGEWASRCELLSPASMSR